MKFQKLAVDSTGLGSPIVESCRSLHLPAEGFNFTQKVKEEMLSNVLLGFEKKRIVIPDDLDLISNLNCIIAEKKAFSDALTFSHPGGTHDELAYALAMAAWVGRYTPVMMGMPELPNRDDGETASMGAMITYAVRKRSILL